MSNETDVSTSGGARRRANPARPGSAMAAGIILFAGSVSFALTPVASWSQWGGASRDFRVDSAALADQWPEEGPKRLWSRKLGEGFSPIVGDGTNLYTMYREAGDEVVVAIRADTGKTVWERRYPAKPHEKQTNAYGQGPNASPLIVDDRLVTLGFTGLMHCLDKNTGEIVWSHDLVKEFNAKPLYYGFSASPLFYRDTIIVPVGGARYGVIAMRPQDGAMVWASDATEVSYAAPVIINVDGQDQFVFFSPDKVIGIDPKNGSFLWSHKVVNFCKTNCTSVVWGEDNLLWAATKGVGGTRVLKLAQKSGKTSVEEVWLKRKIRVYQWNAVRVGDFVYTASGDSAKRFSAINIKTGEIGSQRKGFGATNSIYADGKLIMLDDGGKLALAKVSGPDVSIVSTAQLWESLTWTPPTLIGAKLYVRDRSHIMALDLG